MIFAYGPTTLTLTLTESICPFSITSFHSDTFDQSLSSVRHTSLPLFSAIIAWEKSSLWYPLHAKSLSGKKCRKVPCVLSAGREKKGSYTCGRQTGFSEIWHIYHPSAGYELFCHLNGAQWNFRCWKTCVAHSELSGSWHSKVCNPYLYSFKPSKAPLSPPLAIIYRQSSSAGPSLSCWVQLNGMICSPLDLSLSLLVYHLKRLLSSGNAF